MLTPFLHHAGGFGGISPWLFNLSKCFVERGLSVDVLVNADSSTALEHDSLPASCEFFNLGYHRLQAYFGLRRYLARRRPDVLLGAGHRYNEQAASVGGRQVVSGGVFVSIHENVSVGSTGLPPLKLRRRYAAMRRVARRVDGVIAVSRGVAEDLVLNVGLPPEPIHVIYNPIVDQDLLRRAEASCGHPWLRDKREPVILGVGRLEAQKDFPTLLRAFARARAERPMRLIILGEGRRRTDLEALVAQLGLTRYVSLPGFVTNPMPYMRDVDLFVLSSAWEGFGNVIVEAMAVGTPVVSTDCPSGPAEILEDGRWGALVPVGDHDALAAAMLQALASPPPSAALRTRATDFSAERSAAEYLRVMGLAAGT